MQGGAIHFKVGTFLLGDRVRVDAFPSVYAWREGLEVERRPRTLRSGTEWVRRGRAKWNPINSTEKGL